MSYVPATAFNSLFAVVVDASVLVSTFGQLVCGFGFEVVATLGSDSWIVTVFFGLAIWPGSCDCSAVSPIWPLSVESLKSLRSIFSHKGYIALVFQ